MIYGYLGPEGSYSHLAVKDIKGATCVPYASFNLLMNALKSGDCGVIALPIENSLNGGVNQNIDLLQYTDGVVAFAEKSVKIEHRLAVLKGTKISGISRIYSHQQALAQCGTYLFENFPSAKLIACPSTSASLEMLDETSACIVGAHVKREGVTLLDGNIADEDNNYTHFLFVRRGNLDGSEKSSRVYFSATCRHEPGALISLLTPIRDSGLNMTKIESRPIKEKQGEYRFFVEVEGDYSSKKTKSALKTIEKSSYSFKILGAY